MALIKLLHDHTHADVTLPAGAIIDVDEHDAQWLIAHGIADPAEASDAAADDNHHD